MTRRIRGVLGALSLAVLVGGSTHSPATGSDPACHQRCAEEYQRCQDWGFVEWYCELQYNICTDDCNQ
jgi:hypothetical protein